MDFLFFFVLFATVGLSSLRSVQDIERAINELKLEELVLLAKDGSLKKNPTPQKDQLPSAACIDVYSPKICQDYRHFLGACSLKRSLMSINCRKTCGFCENTAEDTNVKSAQVNSAVEKTNDEDELACQDMSAICHFSRLIPGICGNGIMQARCRASCNMCHKRRESSTNQRKRNLFSKPGDSNDKGFDYKESNFITQLESSCKDVHNEAVCRHFAEFHNYCSKEEKFMTKYCRRTCNFCKDSTPLPECADFKRLCAVFAGYKSICRRHQNFFAVHCPFSCGLCESRKWLPFPKLPEGIIRKLMWQVGEWDKCARGLQWREVRCVNFDHFQEIPVIPSECSKTLGPAVTPVRNCTMAEF